MIRTMIDSLAMENLFKWNHPTMMPPPSASCGVAGCEFATGAECNSYKDRTEELCLDVDMVHMLGRLEERRGELVEEKEKASRLTRKCPSWLNRLLTDSGHCSCMNGVSTRKGVICPLYPPCTSCMGVCLMT